MKVSRILFNKRVLITAPIIPDNCYKMITDRGIIIDQWKDKDENPMIRNELLKRVKDVDGIFCTLNDTINKEVIDLAGNNLKVISTMSVGYNHVDIKECQKKGIKVGFTPEVLTNTTADLCVTLLLTTARRIPEFSCIC